MVPLYDTRAEANPRPTVGISADPIIPLRPDIMLPICARYRFRKEAMPMKRYRRLMVSLGWLAAFLMAAGAGWKTN
jgi:hypothetical protein